MQQGLAAAPQCREERARSIGVVGIGSIDNGIRSPSLRDERIPMFEFADNGLDTELVEVLSPAPQNGSIP